VEKISDTLFLPMDWESARPELMRKQFELARSVNGAADGKLYSARTITASGTMNAGDGVILCDTTSGDVTLSSLSSGDLTNKAVYVKKIDSSANRVLVKCAGSDTIEGSATRTLSVQYQTVVLYSSGGSTIWRL
jgi:hypothetical protein